MNRPSQKTPRVNRTPKSGKFDVGGEGVGFGEDFAALAEVLEVMGDGVVDFLFDFGAGPSGDDAARKIGGKGSVAGTGLFDDDQVFSHGAGKASQSE